MEVDVGMGHSRGLGGGTACGLTSSVAEGEGATAAWKLATEAWQQAT